MPVQHGADRLVGEAAELGLAADGIAHEFHDHQEAHDDEHPCQPCAHDYDFLAGGQRKHDNERGRHHESGNKRTQQQPGITVGEFGGPTFDGMTVFVVVGQCCNGLSDTVFAAGQMHRLADNHVAFLDFPREQAVEIGQFRPAPRPSAKARTTKTSNLPI